MWPVQPLMPIRNNPTVLCHQYYVFQFFRDFEWPSFYSSDSTYPFFGKFRSTCPPRADDSEVREKPPGKTPGKTLGREGTMDGWDSTAGGENQRHTKSVIIRASYRAGEILQFQQDFTTVVSITSNFTVI